MYIAHCIVHFSVRDLFHCFCEHFRRAPDSCDSSTASEGKNCFSFDSLVAASLARLYYT